MFSVEVPRLRRKKKFERVERDVIHDQYVSLWVRYCENAIRWRYLYALAWGVETLVHTCTVLKGY